LARKITNADPNPPSSALSPVFGYAFPAIRGVQARREFFVSMCPLRLLPRIFLFNEEELVPELRAQRVLNKARVPEIARYILDNADTYVFSAITASIDGEVQFTPLGSVTGTEQVGLLQIPMSARFIINDGQHRRAGIEQAIRDRPELADETIAVVFFLDRGLDRCQQMFSDLNRHAIRPAKSLGLLYDHRDDKALLAKQVVAKSVVFRETVELERSTLSLRSRKLFTLSSVYSATSALLQGMEGSFDEHLKVAVRYWDEVAAQFPEWKSVIDRKITAGDVRSDFIHSHGIVLHALGRLGSELLRADPTAWAKRLTRLKKINWSRTNARDWEGRAMIGGRVSKATQNVVLTGNFLKKCLELELTPEELRVENVFKQGALVHA
jgi:DNA sulfur modification protein DndB